MNRNSHPPEEIASLGENYVSLWHDFTVFPTREEISQKVKIYKPRTLANLDCQGRGPGGRMTVGGKVCYPRDQVVIWFAALSKAA
jgi:hypothetical protein